MLHINKNPPKLTKQAEIIDIFSVVRRASLAQSRVKKLNISAQVVVLFNESGLQGVLTVPHHIEISLEHNSSKNNTYCSFKLFPVTITSQQ